jgi:hypothetical protein
MFDMMYCIAFDICLTLWKVARAWKWLERKTKPWSSNPKRSLARANTPAMIEFLLAALFELAFAAVSTAAAGRARRTARGNRA